MNEFAGYCLQPAVNKTMSNEMTITRSEIFAPVVGLYEFGTEEEASSFPKACREVGELQRRWKSVWPV